MGSHEAGTEILSRLGILESSLHSPARKDFTSIRRPSDCSLESSDSEQLLREPLSRTNNHSASPSSRFIKCSFGLSVYFCIAAIILTYHSIFTTSIVQALGEKFFTTLIPNNAATVFMVFGGFNAVGALLLSYFYIRTPTLIFTQICVYISLFVVYLLHNFESFNVFLFGAAVLGAMYGAVERVGFLYITNGSNSHKRSVFAFYAVIALVFAFSTLATNPLGVAHQSEVTRVKRHLDGIENLHLTTPLPLAANVSTVLRPTKPTSAIGINENQDTKTAENAEKRKLAALGILDKVKDKNCENCSTSMPAVISKSIPNTTTTALPLVTTVTPSTTTTTTTAATTTTSILTTLTPSTTTIATKSGFFSDLSKKVDELMVDRSRNRVNVAKVSVTPVPATVATTPVTTDNATTDHYICHVEFVVISVITVVISITTVLSGLFGGQTYRTTLISQFTDASTAVDVPLNIRYLAAIVWVISEGISYSVITLAPFFMGAGTEGEKQYKPLLFFLLWTSIVFIRTIFVGFSTHIVSAKSMFVQLSISVVMASTYFYVEDEYWRVIRVFISAIFLSNISLLLMIYQQDKMSIPPFLVSARYAIWTSVGRFFGPFLISKYLTESNLSVIVFTIVLCTIGCIGVTWLLNQRSNTFARQLQLQYLSSSISGTNVQSVTGATSLGRSGNSNIDSLLGKASRQNGVVYSLIEEGSDGDNRLVSDISDGSDNELL